MPGHTGQGTALRGILSNWRISGSGQRSAVAWGMWTKGPAALRLELKQIRADIPDAQYVVSADYASLKPGYWVVYYAGSFTNGNEALAYCAAHSRTTSNQCYGRYLSHDVKDRFYICLPPGGPRKALCYRP